MSYEGYTQWLCTKGHYFTTDCWDSDPTSCEVCDKPIGFSHSVDSTNGVVDEDPSTCAADIVEIGTYDFWTSDHYGNSYAIQQSLYRPKDPSIWHDHKKET